jgi:hypothetical protein
MVGRLVAGEGMPDKLLMAAHEDLAGLDRTGQAIGQPCSGIPGVVAPSELR